jgi:hypothetical protein
MAKKKSPKSKSPKSPKSPRQTTPPPKPKPRGVNQRILEEVISWGVSSNRVIEEVDSVLEQEFQGVQTAAALQEIQNGGGFTSGYGFQVDDESVMDRVADTVGLLDVLETNYVQNFASEVKRELENGGKNNGKNNESGGRRRNINNGAGNNSARSSPAKRANSADDISNSQTAVEQHLKKNVILKDGLFQLESDDEKTKLLKRKRSTSPTKLHSHLEQPLTSAEKRLLFPVFLRKQLVLQKKWKFQQGGSPLSKFVETKPKRYDEASVERRNRMTNESPTHDGSGSSGSNSEFRLPRIQFPSPRKYRQLTGKTLRDLEVYDLDKENGEEEEGEGEGEEGGEGREKEKKASSPSKEKTGSPSKDKGSKDKGKDGKGKDKGGGKKGSSTAEIDETNPEFLERLKSWAAEQANKQIITQLSRHPSCRTALKVLNILKKVITHKHHNQEPYLYSDIMERLNNLQSEDVRRSGAVGNLRDMKTPLSNAGDYSAPVFPSKSSSERLKDISMNRISENKIMQDPSGVDRFDSNSFTTKSLRPSSAHPTVKRSHSTLKGLSQGEGRNAHGGDDPLNHELGKYIYNDPSYNPYRAFGNKSDTQQLPRNRNDPKELRDRSKLKLFEFFLRNFKVTI